MARRGRTGVKYQVDRALKEINRIGQSKKDARANGEKGYVHSISQNDHNYSACMEYGKWLRHERNKGLYHANKSDYRDYISHKSETCSKGHLINIETSLRHLSHGMNKVSEKHGREPREWVPSERIVSSNEREKPSDRSYTPREVERIREHLPNDRHRDTLDLQNAFGLRLSEAAGMVAAHVVERDDKLYFSAVSDKDALNNSKICKGGRPRETPCRPEYESRVREIIQDKKPEEFLGVKYNTAKDAYSTAAEKAEVDFNGSHGFRHSYARAQLEDRLDERGIKEEGYEVIDRMLENYENGVRKDAGFTLEERDLYKEVNEIIDTVHADLGHGKGRLDLVAVYMR
jgi:integrase